MAHFKFTQNRNICVIKVFRSLRKTKKYFQSAKRLYLIFETAILRSQRKLTQLTNSKNSGEHSEVGTCWNTNGPRMNEHYIITQISQEIDGIATGNVCLEISQRKIQLIGVLSKLAQRFLN